jgi:1,4-dihydroxy-2-naphthoyl-CoA hydrolase
MSDPHSAGPHGSDLLASDDVAALLNGSLDGWAAAMGVVFVRATAAEVVAELEVGPAHRQPYGIVHGGVHAGLIETLASVGAALVALPRGQVVVGLENHTSFLRAARGGRLRATATPISRGRSSQVWEGSVRDEEGRLLATGRVRLLCLADGAELAGAAATVPGAPRAGGSGGAR